MIVLSLSDVANGVLWTPNADGLLRMVFLVSEQRCRCVVEYLGLGWEWQGLV